MSSRYSQHRPLNSSNDMSRASPSHLTQLSRESMLAYGSHQQQGATATPLTMNERVDRTQTPGLERGRKNLVVPKRDGNYSSSWFTRSSKPKSNSQGKGKFIVDKSIISAPLHTATTAPPRPPRPPIEQTPASFYRFQSVEKPHPTHAQYQPRSSSSKTLAQTPQSSTYYPQQQRPPSQTKPLTIQPERLGQRHEALGSHPVVSRLDGMMERKPAARILVPSAAEGQNRYSTVLPGQDRSQFVLREPRISADLMSERRQGRVYAPGELHALPDLSSYQSDDETDSQGQFTDELGDDNYEEDRTWDDGSEDGPEIRDPNVPVINVIKPKDDQPKTTHLKVDDAYKGLYEKQMRELRGLRQLHPLAEIVAEVENIHPSNYEALEGAVKDIIDDHQRCDRLWPLAETLAEDQGLDIQDLEAMRPALEAILADRDRAKHVAGIHKRARKQLERKVRDLESEMASMTMRTSYDENEDYEEYIR